MKKPDPALSAFLASCIVVIFLYGVLVGNYHIFPYSMLKRAQDSVQQVLDERDTLLGVRPTRFLEPARYEGNGVTLWKRDRAVPGLTLLTGFFEGGNELRLVRLDGSIVRRWPVSFSTLFPDTQHIQPPANVPKSDWNTSIHGSLILPDGSVVFNLTTNGTVKLDRCGQVLWTLPRMTHHSIQQVSEGAFWLPSARYVEGTRGLPHLDVPYHFEDTALKVSKDGKVLKEISVLDILYKNDLDTILMSGGFEGDLTHLNDVKELPRDLADRFPLFAAGDLMLSMRFAHLIIVVDPDTLEIKWYQSGPWRGQHDPDFLDDGTISVFSNNYDGTTSGSRFGGSTIIRIDPRNRHITHRYGKAKGQKLYTLDMGKHQNLPLGHLLVTEARAGRAFEVDADGNIVWEFIDRYDETDAALLTSADRYPEDYFETTDWTCP